MPTKKDFEATARVIKSLVVDKDTKYHVAKSFARNFIRENPRFDETKFLKACGVAR